MNIIILGDKYKKGLKSKGCGALVPYKGKTIIDNQYSVLKNLFPQSNVIYIYGFDHKRFNNYIDKNTYDLNTIYNEKYEINNSAYSLNLASAFLEDECIIMFNYTILSKSIFNKFDKSRGSQAFVTHANNSSSIGCIIENNIIRNISPNLNNNILDIYYLNKNDSKIIKQMLVQKKYSNYFIFELMNNLITLGSKIYPYMVKL